jgi:toxin secretion/phage lysis holin
MMKPIAPWQGFLEAWSGIVAGWEVKAAAGTAFAALCSFLDMDQRIAFILCIAIAADFFLGMLDAAKRGRFRCRAVVFGTTKIFWYIIYIGIVSAINQTISYSLSYRFPLLDLFMSYLVASDCVSITGHLQSLGVPVPALLKYIVKGTHKNTSKKIKKIVDSIADSKPKSKTEDDNYGD